MRLTSTIMSTMNRNQSGAVSLFVVIFAALLITVVTVSFLRLMVHDQQQSFARDLSQSAYDSAQAGVEDAKRSLLRFQTVCSTSQSDCDSLRAEAVNSWGECNVALEDVVGVVDGEVSVQQTSGDASLDQAYTCVTVDLQTDDFLGALNPGESKIIPILGTSTVSTIEISWYSRDDLTVDTGDAYDVELVTPTSPLPLNSQSNWPDNRPSVLRAQFMQFSNDGFTLSDFDDVDSDDSNANTLFLYPMGTSGVANSSSPDTVAFIEKDLRQTGSTGEPLGVNCSGNIDGGGYACKVRIELPDPIGAGDRTAYLRLTPFYNSTHFSAVIRDGSGAIVPFDSVQPAVDSTGRANDYFRRVETRVELIDNTYPYPDNAVDISGDFCKDFAVTDDVNDYVSNDSCTP